MKQLDWEFIKIIGILEIVGICCLVGGLIFSALLFITMGTIVSLGVPIAFIIGKSLHPKETWKDVFTKGSK